MEAVLGARQADLHKTTVQPLSRASPDHSGATCHSPSLQTSCSVLHSDNESCLERKKGTNKSKRSSSPSLRLQISEEHCARQIGWGQESSHSYDEESSLLVSCAPTGSPVAGEAPACSWVAKAEHPLRRLGGAGSQQRQQARGGHSAGVAKVTFSDREVPPCPFLEFEEILTLKTTWESKESSKGASKQPLGTGQGQRQIQTAYVLQACTSHLSNHTF